MSGDSDDDVSFHLLMRPPAPLSNTMPPNRKDCSTSTSSSSSTSSSRSTSSSEEQVQATTQGPPSKRQRKGKGKGRKSRPEKSDRDVETNEGDKHQRNIDSTKLCSTAALGWAQRVCSFAYENGGKCAYDHVDVFTEFSGSTCAESAVESVINHMDPKPTVNFCYSADIKSGCRKVAMSTRYDLGCFKHIKKTCS